MQVRTRKYKFKDSNFIHKTFFSWYSDYRYSYNKATWISNESTCNYTGYELTNLIVPTIQGVNDHIPWINKTPSALRQQAVQLFASNKQGCFTNLKNKNTTHFTTPFMKKNSRWCINLPSNCIKSIRNKYIKIFNGTTNDFKFRLTKELPKSYIGKKLPFQHKIYFDGLNFWLLLVEEIPEKISKKGICSVDPGIRKLATVYSNKTFRYFGKKEYIHLKKIVKKIEIAQSKKNKKLKLFLENKKKKILTNLYHQISNYLLKKFNSILIPTLDIKQLLRKGKNNRWYNKMILSMGVLTFLENLKTKSSLYINSTIYSNSVEHYSSKLCSRCCTINFKKNESEIFSCSNVNCKLIKDRDYNAAKNIYFMNKHLV